MRAKTVETLATCNRVGPATGADIQSWQAKMRSVVLDVIDEDEVRAVLEAMLVKAKGGDLAAARLVLSYAVGSPQQRAADGGPTGARAGTNGKLDVLAHRAALGVALHQNGDGGKVDLS
jgi:hypothetical protein